MKYGWESGYRMITMSKSMTELKEKDCFSIKMQISCFKELARRNVLLNIDSALMGPNEYLQKSFWIREITSKTKRKVNLL